ncbi:MAG: DUF1361 domain-containing protein [Flavobacteriales bacterium]|nr:DUF1361 domain-containing protein [Flavobacteriales bacterium]
MKIKLPDYLKTVILLTLVNLIILGIRNLIVGDSFFSFLKSNLFIGSMPTIVIAFLLKHYYERLNAFFFWAGTALWVLFYPNAPYMISDLIHNSADPQNAYQSELVKYDTLIIFSLAMLSVFYGFLSLKIMFNLFRKRHGRRFAHIAIFITVALSCLGFYMGRELISAIKLGNGYMYSWEIFLEPVAILKTVWKALVPVGEHWPAYAMMALIGIIQYMLLIMFKDVGDVESSTLVTKDE